MKNRICKVLNYSEKNVYKILKSIEIKHNCTVLNKIRIADTILIKNSGIRNKLYNYALSSHFDFLICNSNFFPLFAVEFDGPLHESQDQLYKDHLKNELCDLFELPILRINNKYSYQMSNEFNYLTWLIEFYFAFKDFEKEKKTNPDLNHYEIFTPSLIYSIDGCNCDYPLCPSFKIRNKFFKMHLDNIIHSIFPNIIIFIDPNERIYHSLGYIQVYEGEFAISTQKIKDNSFLKYEFLDDNHKNLCFSELLTEITMIDLFNSTECILNKSSSTLNKSELENLKYSLNKKFIYLNSR